MFEHGQVWVKKFQLDGTYINKFQVTNGDAAIYSSYDGVVYKNEIFIWVYEYVGAPLFTAKGMMYVLDLDGNFKRSWEVSGINTQACNFVIKDDKLYLSDSGFEARNVRIKVYDLYGVEEQNWAPDNVTTQSYANLDVANDKIWLWVNVNTGGDDYWCLRQYDLSGNFEQEYTINILEAPGPSMIQWHNNELYFLYGGGNSILVLDENFSIVAAPGGSFDGDYRSGVVYDSDIYTSDYEKIQRWERKVDSNDLVPSDMAKDILTNNLYGLKMSLSDLESISFDDTETYCENNDLRISMLIDGKISMLDLLGNLTSYHNGYVVYEDGKIAYKQIESEANVTIVTVATDVIAKDPPVDMNRESFRDVRNKVIVSYTKRDDAYSTGIVVAEDEIHQQSNEIKETSISLPAFCTGARAMKVAYTILRRAIEMPMSYSFAIGPKKAADLVPGVVFGLTDTQLGINEKPLRVISTSENDDGTIQIEAMEEITFLLDAKFAPSDDYYIPPDRLGDPGNVRYPVIVELPPLVSGAKNAVVVSFGSSTQVSWFGATVYDSYDDSTYIQKEASVGECLMGEVNSVTDDSITVTITDSDESLNNKTDVFALLQDLNFNACYNKTQDSFFRFAKATLVSGAQWKLEGIIWNCYSVPILTHSAVADDVISFMKYKQAPIDLEYDIARKGSTIYYKIPSYNYAGVAQSLSDISSENISFNAKGTAPIAPMNLEVDSLGSITKIGSGNIKINWETCNRKDRGLDYTRSDQITEDTDFVRFDVKVIDNDTSTTLRTTTTTDTDWTYTSVMQTEDGDKTNLKFEVEKVSETNRSETSELIVEIV